MQIGDAQRCLRALLEPWQVFELWRALSEPLAQGTAIFEGDLGALFRAALLHRSTLHNAL